MAQNRASDGILILIMLGLFNEKFKTYVQTKMEGYVVSYFKAHPEVKLVVVAGSVGKTSTKVALSTILGQKYRVRLHDGNHNTEMSAPLAILGIPYPNNIKSLSEWRKVFRAAEARIVQPADVDIIIQELGTDQPGDLARFARYLQPDIAVITAITPEHMEFFGTMEAVAREELTAANFSKLAIINRDDIDSQYAAFMTNTNVTTYGTTAQAEYHFVQAGFSVAAGFSGQFIAPEFGGRGLPVSVRVLGEHNMRPVIAAATVALKCGMTPQEIATGMAAVTAVPGRMSMLEGTRGSLLIDDTYNSSPVAAVAAIETLLSIEAPQRIAILGTMNELGESSASEHAALGRLVAADTVEWVITVGEDAHRYLAPEARARGCQVKECENAMQAGAFARGVLQDNAVVLIKGSQNNGYLEEATKMLLKNHELGQQLVRQSPGWMAKKEEYFSHFS